MNIKNDNILLFPIDTVSRELEWQLIVALESAKKFGTMAVIGHKYFLRGIHKNSSNCICIGRLGSPHGSTEGDLSIIHDGNRNNSTFLYLHDEGGFYPIKDYESIFLQSLPVAHAKQSDRFEFLVWGEEQRQLLDNAARKEKFEGGIRITGMPRFDLYKKEWYWLDEENVNGLNEKYDRFTLIVTRFGNANSNENKYGHISKASLEENLMIGDDAKIDACFERWGRDHKDFSDFAKMLRQVFKAFPEKQFIIRPHPSEDATFYRQVFGHYPNVKIIREGDVRPWIKACEGMIHNGCTTGVEAVLAGKRVINYVPGDPSPYDIAIAYEAGYLAKTPEEVMGFMDGPFEDTAMQFSEYAIRRLYNIHHQSLPVFEDVLTEYLNHRPKKASVEIDNYLIRNLRLLKYKHQQEKLIKQRNGLAKDVGRRVRLSDLPIRRIEKIVSGFNQKNNFQAKVRLLSNIGIVVGPK